MPSNPHSWSLLNRLCSFIMPIPLPARLYKYCHPKDAVILESERIAYTPPERFNDPFDFAPAVDLTNDEESRRKEWNRFSSETPGVQVPSCDEYISHIQTNATELEKGDAEALTRAYNDTFGLFCLSSNPSDCAISGPLMWSHYADSHRGFVIEFDAGHEFFMKRYKDSRLQKVKYTSDRPFLKQPADLQNILPAKASCWEYENEWRCLEKFTLCEPPILSDTGDCIYLHPFPKESILKVSCGCRMNSELFKYLQINLPKWGYQCSLEKMAMHPKAYRLLPEPSYTSDLTV